MYNVITSNIDILFTALQAIVIFPIIAIHKAVCSSSGFYERFLSKSFLLNSSGVLAVCFIFILGSATLEQIVRSEHNTAEKLSGLPENWGIKLPPEQREKDSKAYASVAFISGNAVKYYNAKEGWISYFPLPSDIHQRELLVSSLTSLRIYSRTLILQALSTFCALAIAIISGLRKKHAKKS